jgi:hypothetical protein
MLGKNGWARKKPMLGYSDPDRKATFYYCHKENL